MANVLLRQFSAVSSLFHSSLYSNIGFSFDLSIGHKRLGKNLCVMSLREKKNLSLLSTKVTEDERLRWSMALEEALCLFWYKLIWKLYSLFWQGAGSDNNLKTYLPLDVLCSTCGYIIPGVPKFWVQVRVQHRAGQYHNEEVVSGFHLSCWCLTVELLLLETLQSSAKKLPPLCIRWVITNCRE